MENRESKSNGIGTKFLLASAAIIVIFAGLKASQSLIAPFLLAVFFAMILMPPLQWLKRKGLSDAVALISLSAIVFLFGLGVILILGSSLTRFADRLPTYKEKMTVGITKFDDWVNSVMDRFDLVEEALPRFLPPSDDEPQETPDSNDNVAVSPRSVMEKTDAEKAAASEKERFSLFSVIQFDALFGYIQTGVKETLNIASVSFLVAVMVIFMLIEAAGFPKKVKEAFGGRDLSNEYFQKIADDTWNYTKIKTIVSLLTGVATSIGLWFLGVEYALLWGLLMFFLNYIPNIGPIIASIPPILLALVDQSVSMAVIVTGWLIFVNFLFGYGVEPRYLGEGLGISSLIVLLSLIFWGWLLGPIGMFLSAPLTMVLKIVLQNGANTRWVAVLMSNR